MHAFEDLVDRLLRREGFWTRHSVKVDLRPEDKRSLGKPSLPRPELDLVAYRPRGKLLALVECKSYLDSPGVSITAFRERNPRFAERYRLFTDSALRELITDRLKEQLADSGAIPSGVRVQYWLVAGHIARQSVAPLRERFDREPAWELRGPDWIASSLQALKAESYEDDIVTMAMKLSTHQSQ